MILGIGIDLLDVARVARELEEDDRGLLPEFFTKAEIAYCSGKRYPARHYAARIAAKEALFKALGSSTPENYWKSIEVVRGREGPPQLVLSGPVKIAADQLGVKNIFLSLSHTDDMATASVILEG
jgi:holo-[acyl-carrier protein] synthase